LIDQAQAYGCRVETYPENAAVYLRDVPTDLQNDATFEQFVEQVQQHNRDAIRIWKQGQ
jgi:hypothetical protein